MRTKRALMTTSKIELSQSMRRVNTNTTFSPYIMKIEMISIMTIVS